jgi:hypothetical protein
MSTLTLNMIHTVERKIANPLDVKKPSVNDEFSMYCICFIDSLRLA